MLKLLTINQAMVYMLRKKAINSLRMQTMSQYNSINNDDIKKIKNGCTYCIRAETMNVVKIGTSLFCRIKKVRKLLN